MHDVIQSDLQICEKEQNIETQNFVVTPISSFLPNLEPLQQNGLDGNILRERALEMQTVETILEPFLTRNLLPCLDHIDAQIPESQYESACNLYTRRKNWRILEQFDDSTIFESPIGPMVLKKLSVGEAGNLGYKFHFNTNPEDFENIIKYLSSYYNDSEGFLYLRRPLRPTFKHDKKNNQVEYTFKSTRYKFGVVITPINILEETVLLDEDKTPIVPQPEESIEITEEDLTDKKDDLEIFLDTATILLRLGSYTIKYNENTIYDKRDPKEYSREIEAGPFKISFTGEDNYPGIELFLGLLHAYLKYNVELESLEVIGYEEYGRLQSKYFKEKLQLPLLGTESFPKSFDTGNNVKLSVGKEKRENRFGRGRLIWNIKIPSESFDNVIRTILETSGGTLYKNDLLGSSIKIVVPDGYTYFINAPRC